MRKKIKNLESHLDRPISTLIVVSEEKKIEEKMFFCLKKDLENIHQILNSSNLKQSEWNWVEYKGTLMFPLHIYVIVWLFYKNKFMHSLWN